MDFPSRRLGDHHDAARPDSAAEAGARLTGGRQLGRAAPEEAREHRDRTPIEPERLVAVAAVAPAIAEPRPGSAPRRPSLAIVVLSTDFALPVTARYQRGPPGADQFGDPVILFDLRYGYAIAAFLPLATLDHLLVASPKVVNSFAVNIVLQYRKVGPWREYRFGEAMYLLLSLTARSAVAWQIFAGTLQS